LNEMNRSCSGVDLSCLLNMDETPCYYDSPESRTVDFVGAKSVNVVHSGSDKARFTVTVTFTASGELLKFYVILRG